MNYLSRAWDSVHYISPLIFSCPYRKGQIPKISGLTWLTYHDDIEDEIKENYPYLETIDLR